MQGEEESGGAEAAKFDFVPERKGFDRYLEDTIVVDWQTPAVLEKARELVEGRAEEVDRLTSLFQFVRDEIHHSFDVETDVVTCNASHVLKEGTGLCYAKCHLLAALFRARGTPAGFGYQRLTSDAQPGRFVLHGFLGVWWAGGERWVVLDPRGNNERVHTELDLEAPSFAFRPDPELGELTYPTLWARPSKRVVDLLDYADSLSRIRHHLPDGPE